MVQRNDHERMANLLKRSLAGMFVAAGLAHALASATSPTKDADERVAHHAIVQYVAVRTFLPEKLCETASAPVRADVDEVVRRFRTRFPELVRLAEASPLFADANQPNLQTIQDFESRSRQEHDEVCAQLRNEIAVDLGGDQAYFDKWTRALRKQVRFSD